MQNSFVVWVFFLPLPFQNLPGGNAAVGLLLLQLILRYIYKITDGRTVAVKILVPVFVCWTKLKGDTSVENWACLVLSMGVSDLE